MSTQNPHVESPHEATGDEAIQPTSPDFIEMPEVPALNMENEPMPVWLYIICGLALFLAGSSFTGFEVYGRNMLDQGPGGPIASNVAPPAAPPTAAELGKSLYNGNCANCHQTSGEGQPGSYPPLAGSEWVLGNKKRLAAIMLAGASGPITVKGGSFGTQVMPGWAGVFTDEKLADITTYLRATWGNSANPVTPEEIAAARSACQAHMSSPYSEADLLGIAPQGPDPSDKK
jgi:mono/diheme cytochrome c family protein